MIQIIPGHGWADLIAMLLVIVVAVVGFLLALPVLISYTDPDADGVPERWPR